MFRFSEQIKRRFGAVVSGLRFRDWCLHQGGHDCEPHESVGRFSAVVWLIPNFTGLFIGFNLMELGARC